MKPIPETISLLITVAEVIIYLLNPFKRVPTIKIILHLSKIRVQQINNSKNPKNMP